MTDTREATVPDIGDFTDVPVIEVLVKPGDRVEKDQGLVTLDLAEIAITSGATLLRELVGDGLLTSDEPRHRERRRG